MPVGFYTVQKHLFHLLSNGLYSTWTICARVEPVGVELAVTAGLVPVALLPVRRYTAGGETSVSKVTHPEGCSREQPGRNSIHPAVSSLLDITV